MKVLKVDCSTERIQKLIEHLSNLEEERDDRIFLSLLSPLNYAWDYTKEDVEQIRSSINSTREYFLKPALSFNNEEDRALSLLEVTESKYFKEVKTEKKIYWRKISDKKYREKEVIERTVQVNFIREIWKFQLNLGSITYSVW